MSTDFKTILFGHLAFIALAAVLLVMQYLPIELPRVLFSFAMIAISFCAGPWAALGLPKRSGASLLTAIILWAIAGISTIVIITMNNIERMREAREAGIKCMMRARSSSCSSVALHAFSSCSSVLAWDVSNTTFQIAPKKALAVNSCS